MQISTFKNCHFYPFSWLLYNLAKKWIISWWHNTMNHHMNVLNDSFSIDDNSWNISRDCAHPTLKYAVKMR